MRIFAYFKTILSLLGILAGIIFISQKSNVFPLHDYLEYWSAGRINLSGGNPYSPEEMIILQRQIGRTQPNALMMWNPPWLLAFTMPFSMINYPISRILWFLLEILVLFISAEMIWKIYEGNPRQRWIGWLVVFSFGPMLHTLKLGQISPFLLLGNAGFIYFLKKQKPFWAGIFSSLIFLKPHLQYLLITAILLWIVKTRNLKIFAGLTLGIILPYIIASLPNTQLTTQYLYAIQNYPPEDWQTATLGMQLRLLLNQELFFLQFIPSFLGLVWFLFYWLFQNKKWNWGKNLPLLIIVSSATAAYGWAHDVSIITLAVIQIAAYFNFREWSLTSMVIFGSYWLVNLFNIFLSVTQHWFWWLSSFCLLWYVFAIWGLKQKAGLILNT